MSQVIKLNKRVPVMTFPSRDPGDVCFGKNIDSKQTYDRLHVCYGDQEIPFETSIDVVGFRYNPTTNSIRINPNFDFDVQPNAKIRLLYTAVNRRLMKSGKVGIYGVE